MNRRKFFATLTKSAAILGTAAVLPVAKAEATKTTGSDRYLNYYRSPLQITMHQGSGELKEGNALTVWDDDGSPPEIVRIISVKLRHGSTYDVIVERHQK